MTRIAAAAANDDNLMTMMMARCVALGDNERESIWASTRAAAKMILQRQDKSGHMLPMMPSSSAN